MDSFDKFKAILLSLLLIALVSAQFDTNPPGECPDGQFYIHNYCQRCSKKCKTCMNQATNCLSCDDPAKYILEGTCVDQCPDEYYATQTRLCEACDPSCGTCSAQGCLKCIDKNYFIYRDKCVKECPPSTITHTQSQQCLECPQNCSACIPGTIKCGTCKEGFGLLHNECVACVSNQFTNRYSNCEGILTANLACATQCGTCKERKDYCLSCATQYYQNGANTCVDTCPSSTVPISQSCEKCHFSCKECKDQTTNCTSCSEKFDLLENGKCVKYCSPGFYNNGYGECLGCHDPNCQECSSSSCRKCNYGFYLHFTKCVQNCPADTQPNSDSGACEGCPEECSSCYISTTECGTCKEGYGLAQGECIPCAAHEFTNNYSHCETCSTDCATCEAASTYCTSCFNSTDVLYHGKCLASCPCYTFNSNNICMQCQFGCKTCTQAQICEECFQTLSLNQEGKCVGNCGDQFFSWEGLCEKCLNFDPEEWNVAKIVKSLDQCPKQTLPHSQCADLVPIIEQNYLELTNSSSTKDLLKLANSLLLNETNQELAFTSESFSMFSLFFRTRSDILQQFQDFNLNLEINEANQGTPKSNIRIGISIWKNGLWMQSSSTFPTFVINFYDESNLLDNFNPLHPINLILDFKGTPPNAFTAKWANLRWERKDADAILTDSRITLEISRSGIYSIFLTPTFPEPYSTNENDYMLLVVLYTFIVSFLFLSLTLDCCFHCKRATQYFPHQRHAQKPMSCKRVFLFSFFYNMPLLNISSYQSLKTPAIMKAAWLAIILCTVHYSSMLIVHFKLCNLQDDKSKYLVSGILGLLFVPQLYLLNCKRSGVSNQSTIEPNNEQKGNKETQFYQISPESSDRISVTSQIDATDQLTRKIQKRTSLRVSCLLLIILLLCASGVISLGLVIIWEKEFRQNHHVLAQSLVFSLVVGLVLITARVTTASLISVNCNQSKCMKCLFVDSLTARVVDAFSPEKKHQIPSENTKN